MNAITCTKITPTVVQKITYLVTAVIYFCSLQISSHICDNYVLRTSHPLRYVSAFPKTATTAWFVVVHIYRMSQEECARLREGVPYVKVYRYNPKHLCLKLKGHGDNGQRKVWSSGGPTQCTCQLTSLIEVRPSVWCQITTIQLTLVSWTVNIAAALWMVTSVLASCVTYSAWNTKDNYDMSASVFVVQFNGFMSLTS
jgi:hypothetical protein